MKPIYLTHDEGDWIRVWSRQPVWDERLGCWRGPKGGDPFFACSIQKAEAVQLYGIIPPLGGRYRIDTQPREMRMAVAYPPFPVEDPKPEPRKVPRPKIFLAPTAPGPGCHRCGVPYVNEGCAGGMEVYAPRCACYHAAWREGDE